MAQPSAPASTRPAAASSFRHVVALAVEPGRTDGDGRIAAVRVVDGSPAGQAIAADAPEAGAVLSGWTPARPLVAYGVREAGAGEALSYLPAVLGVPLLDARQIARILLPRLRAHDLATVTAGLDIPAPDGPALEQQAMATARVFLGLLDYLYTLTPETLYLLARLAHGVEGVYDLFVEAEAYRVRTAFARPARMAVREDLCIPSRNVDGNGVIGQEEWLEDAEDADAFQLLDPDEIAGLFDRDGLFERTMDRYEHRPQQIAMVRGVSRAFNAGECLVVEAGTGTGKSLSYLVPAIFWAVRNDQRVIVSTNTKNLQEQLFFKDIPFLLKALGTDFRAALLKGRWNYLCPDRWRQVTGQPDDHLTPEEREAALYLAVWAEETATGDVSEHTGFSPAAQPGFWQKVNAEGGACPRCIFQEACFVNRARSAAALSHLVIVNHALLFSDLAADNAVLASYTHLIVDEAHNLEKVAVQHMTVEASGWRIRTLLRKLYARDGVETGVLATLKWRAERVPMRQVWKDALAAATRLAIDRVAEVEQASEAFFEAVNYEATVRASDGGNGYAAKLRYTKTSAFTPFLQAQAAPLMQRFMHLRDALGRLGETINDIPSSWIADRDELLNTIAAGLEGCKTVEEHLAVLTEAEEEGTVFWVEASGQGSRLSCTLIAAPLNVADRLYEGLFSRMRTVVLTSATLAVGTKFTYMADRLGLRNLDPGRLKGLRIGSPFDYEDQALVCVPSDFPSPKTGAFQQAVSELIQGLAVAARRNTLVLFTAYGMLNRTYADLKDPLERCGIPVLAQGISGARSLLLDRFRQAEGAVLLGTDSFWEGIDLPGEALQIVVLVKLPFAVPSEPVVQAQIEQLDQAGRNSFLEFLVPEAVIKFRQGFGRLIRSAEDHGAVVVLDQRVIGTQYGRLFLDSLPTRHRVFRTGSDLVEGVTRWFGERRRGGGPR